MLGRGRVMLHVTRLLTVLIAVRILWQSGISLQDTISFILGLTTSCFNALAIYTVQ